ncbi:MAG: STAS domain-containing protein [Roseitalea porphyridii]
MSLDVTTDVREGIVLVTLTGELDIYTVNGFRRVLDELDVAGGTLAVDLTGVTLLDSSGLGALVSLLNRAREANGRLGLICPHRRLRRLFEITGLRRSFIFADDLPALRGLLAAPPEE